MEEIKRGKQCYGVLFNEFDSQFKYGIENASKSGK